MTKQAKPKPKTKLEELLEAVDAVVSDADDGNFGDDNHTCCHVSFCRCSLCNLRTIAVEIKQLRATMKQSKKALGKL